MKPFLPMNIWISSKLNFMVIDLEFQKNIKISLNWRFCNFVETQNSIVENCVSTIFHYGILCFHNFPIIGSMVFVETQFGTMEFCVSTIFHYGILCFHKVPPILMNQSMINEGGTLANFFSEPFQFPSSKIDQTWISMIGPPGKPSNSPHFFHTPDHHFGVSI